MADAELQEREQEYQAAGNATATYAYCYAVQGIDVDVGGGPDLYQVHELQAVRSNNQCRGCSLRMVCHLLPRTISFRHLLYSADMALGQRLIAHCVRWSSCERMLQWNSPYFLLQAHTGIRHFLLVVTRWAPTSDEKRTVSPVCPVSNVSMSELFVVSAADSYCWQSLARSRGSLGEAVQKGRSLSAGPNLQSPAVGRASLGGGHSPMELPDQNEFQGSPQGVRTELAR